jgi:peptide/nickel transport system permease protein
VRMILRKVAILIPTVLAVSLLTFLLISLLPGDPAVQILGPQGASDPEAVETIRKELKLDKPLYEQYGHWLGNVLTGDLGRSRYRNQDVRDAIFERLPVTVQIGGMALVLALLLAIPFGIFSAYRSNTPPDKVITTGTFGLLAAPTFVMGLLLIYLFALRFGIFPSSGWTRFSDDPVGNLKTAALPAMSLALAEFAVYSRLLRTDMIATLQQDFIMMAKAKGMPTWRILLRHALRPSSFSLLTVVGLQVGGLIGGSVIVEQIFALPGLGRLLYDSITQRDLIMVQGIVLFLALSYVLVNFLVDLLYSVLDPRIRHG